MACKDDEDLILDLLLPAAAADCLLIWSGVDVNIMVLLLMLEPSAAMVWELLVAFGLLFFLLGAAGEAS